MCTSALYQLKARKIEWFFFFFFKSKKKRHASLVAQWSRICITMSKTQVWSLGWDDPLEKGKATHSSILAWEVPSQRSLVGYSPWGHKGVGYDLATKQQQNPHILFLPCILLLPCWTFTHTGSPGDKVTSLWMEKQKSLEGIMLSETSQRKTNTEWHHLHVESKNYNKLVNITQNKQLHRSREQTTGYHNYYRLLCAGWGTI